MKLIITCEHGGNRIPREYAALFRNHRALLASHRGYDAGALSLARHLASAFDAAFVYSTTSRLLVELNRSSGNRNVFSELTRNLRREDRELILQRYYWPYRTRVEAWVSGAISRSECVVHISSHSFTPMFAGQVRNADIGLLYDPSRAPERDLCLEWQRELRSTDPRLTVRRNHPYRGTADGLTTYLRRFHEPGSYYGIEIEVNQKHATAETAVWRSLRSTIVQSLRRVLNAHLGSGRERLHAA